MRKQTENQRRLVTSAEFWFHVARKSLLMNSGFAVAGGAVVAGLYLGGVLIKDTSYILFHLELPEGGWPEVGWYVLLFKAIISVATFLTCCGVLMRKKAAEIDPGTPFAHVDTDHWPVAETLVRASEEPEQEQKNRLLRPAQKVAGSSPDQLLRPIMQMK
jgi:hypothetical protein